MHQRAAFGISEGGRKAAAVGEDAFHAHTLIIRRECERTVPTGEVNVPVGAFHVGRCLLPSGKERAHIISGNAARLNFALDHTPCGNLRHQRRERFACLRQQAQDERRRRHAITREVHIGHDNAPAALTAQHRLVRHNAVHHVHLAHRGTHNARVGQDIFQRVGSHHIRDDNAVAAVHQPLAGAEHHRKLFANGVAPFVYQRQAVAVGVSRQPDIALGVAHQRRQCAQVLGKRLRWAGKEAVLLGMAGDDFTPQGAEHIAPAHSAAVAGIQRHPQARPANGFDRHSVEHGLHVAAVRFVVPGAHMGNLRQQ